MGLAAFNRSRRAAAEKAKNLSEEVQAGTAQEEEQEEHILANLREKAKSLGIENAGRKGLERLKEEIATAEASLEHEREAAEADAEDITIAE
ncbi:hypothetical protein [Paenibacillus ferrarius]|uniref:hypothetical protein n=1 Tax=Paenibacillus ferrarius TaxID=1469647 RepID=UPI003D267C70